jgi:putative DNA primase/helicase
VNTSMSSLLESGLGLIPIPLGKKGPCIPNWNARENVVTTAEEVWRLTNCNIGLAHSYCSPSPTCAIDIDYFPSALGWLWERDVDLPELLDKEDAVALTSGKKNSTKLFYRLPKNVGALCTKQILDDGAVSLEFRCAASNGTTVQDLIPPSIHPAGRAYEWVGKGNILELPEIPNSLLKIWSELIRATKQERLTRPLYQKYESPRERALVRDMLSYISADCGYILWRDIVWSILSLDWECSLEIANTWSETCPDQYDEDTFWLLANSYNLEHPASKTIGTIMYHARQCGWNG